MKIFWSWQSDTPGKTGRFFVRDCLVAAIERLKDAEEIAEPTEREVREAMHVDSDRQGVPGSPDLANVIFQKIDAAQVVIADVTPVARIQARKLADGSRARAKRNMNPNVAIELGYALKSRGSEKVLMVLNEHHGKREHLPFDLAHKAGPLMYKLSDNPPKTEIETAREVLTAQFVNALRPYISMVADELIPKQRPAIPSTFAPFAYFERGASLAEVGERGDDEIVDYSYFDHRGFYLRLIPERAPSGPLGRVALREALSAASMAGLDRDVGGFYCANSFGAIAFDVDPKFPGHLANSTQVFSNAEIWGINRDFIASIRDELIVPSVAIEQVYRQSLSRYIEFARSKLSLDYPFKVVAGVSGLDGVSFGVQAYGGGQRVPFLVKDLEIDRRLVAQQDHTPFLLAWFQEIWDACGLRRPDQIGGFPPSPSAV